MTSQEPPKLRKSLRHHPRLAGSLFTSMDCAPTVCVVSLFLGAPVSGRAAATGLEGLLVQWRKPDLVGKEHTYEKTQRMHAK